MARHPVPCAWACTRSRSGLGSLPLTARSPHPWTEQGESAPCSRPSEGRPGVPFRVPCRTPPRPDPRLPGTGPRGPRHVFAGLCAVLTTRASSQPRSRRHPAPSIRQKAPSPQPSTRSRFYRDDVLLYNQKGHIHVCSQPCEKKNKTLREREVGPSHTYGQGSRGRNSRPGSRPLLQYTVFPSGRAPRYGHAINVCRVNKATLAPTATSSGEVQPRLHAFPGFLCPPPRLRMPPRRPRRLGLPSGGARIPLPPGKPERPDVLCVQTGPCFPEPHTPQSSPRLLSAIGSSSKRVNQGHPGLLVCLPGSWFLGH